MPKPARSREGKRPATAPAEGAAAGGRAAKAPRVASSPLSAAAGATVAAAAPRGFVGELVQGLLPPHGAAQVVESKLVGRVVALDNPPSGSGGSGSGAGASARSSARPWSRGPRLSRREMRERGLSRVVNAEGCRFRDFVPLHRLWQQYMDELLQPGGGGGPVMADKLAKADYHGALIRVVESRCPSLVGVTGIVLHETENTVVLMCDDDKQRTVPKLNSVFALRHGESLATVHGSHICFRASERARHKFKARATMEL